MAKRKATNLKRKALEGKTSIVEVMKASSGVGQDQYKIQDPSERLVAIVGTMGNEPKYYPTDPGSQAVGYKYDTADFDEQAQLVVNTALEVAESESPKDLVQIAHWARKELKMRTTPQILLAIAAEGRETKQFVREYAPKIINRADELKQGFIAYRSLFGHDHMLPNSLKKGLADAFRKFRPLDFVKYEGKERPYFADVLKMVDRRKGYPLSPELDHYLKTGEITNPEKLPQIAARKELHKMKEFGPQAVELAAKSRANWEVLLSQFGNTKEVWEHLIDTDSLGYMALMRNLRNILQAGVGKRQLNKVTKKLVEGAKTSKQLPFRFLTAKMMLDAECGSCRGVNQVTEALDKAVEEVSGEMSTIPGATLVVVDSSGSMSSPVSGKSKMTCIGAGAMLAGMLYSNSSEGSVVGHFADRFKEIRPGNKGPMQVAEQIIREQGSVGYGTNCEDVLRWAIKNKKKFDRIVIFSDMQTYGGGYWGGRYDQLWDQYKRSVNKDAVLHSVDLAGHGKSLTKQSDTDVNLVSGYSEKLLDTFLRFEGINPETGVQNKEEKEFTIEYIRENY